LTLDEAVTSILLLYEQGLGNYFGRANAAATLRILHPVLVAGTPPFLPVQEEWIRENFTRESLAPKSKLVPSGSPDTRNEELKALRWKLLQLLRGDSEAT